MSDPNTTPPPYRGGPGGPAGPPGFTPPPAAPGQFPHSPQTPMQTPAQAYAQWNHVEGWVPELGVRIAPAGVRIGAKAIDIGCYLVLQIVVGIVIALVWIATGGIESDTFSTGSNMFATSSPDLLFSIAAGIVLLAVDLLYNVVCTARFGGTPGKLMVGIKVIYQDGRRIDLRGAFLRFSPILGLTILGMVPIVNILASLVRLGLLIANLVLVLVDDRRKDVFDRIGSTYVISAR